MTSDKERVSRLVDALAPELKRLALDIHDNPELGLAEFKACAWQKALLEKYGFSVEGGEQYGLPTAYKAVYKGAGSGPVLAFLAEYDALPELGHGCGHNLIAMVACGCGIACREFADRCGAEIRVYGTPAEESAGGKVTMANAGAFDDCDAVMMAHPGFMSCDAVNTMALNNFRIEFFGRPAHAAGAPQEGVNALDAMICFFNLVNAMRQQVRPDARLHGIITDGGAAPNIIPDYTAAEFYVRAPRIAEVEALAQRVRSCAQGAALGTGCSWKMELKSVPLKDTRSNRALNELAVGHVEQFAAEKLYRTHGVMLPGSSDVGDVSYRAPVIQLGFKIGEYPNPAGGSHTPEFVAAAGSEYGMDSGLAFVKGLVMTAVELMTDPAKLAEIRDEFRRDTAAP